VLHYAGELRAGVLAALITVPDLRRCLLQRAPNRVQDEGQLQAIVQLSFISNT